MSVCCIHSHTCYCRQRQPSSKQKTHLACLPHKPFHTRSQSTETGSHGLLTRQYNSVVQHTLYHARLQSLFGHAETLVESKRPQKYSPCSIISDFFWFRQKKCGKLIVPRFTSELMESDTGFQSIIDRNVKFAEAIEIYTYTFSVTEPLLCNSPPFINKRLKLMLLY